MIKEFLKYAIPSALSMFVSSLYTIIDGIFVGQGVGDLALAAINIVIPITIMFFGIATMFAVGGGALVSKHLGAKEEDLAVDAFRQVFKLLFIISLCICLFCNIFSTPIVKVLGATENTIDLAATYLRYYSIFCIPNLLGIALNSFIRNDGRPRLAMIATISGAVTNIVLDYLFIFTFGMGIKGAAIATGLGQIVTIAIMIPHFILKQGTLSFGKVKLNKLKIKEFSSIGLPSFFAEITFSIVIFLQNIAIVRIIGDIGLSAFSIINYLTTNIYMVLIGVAFGVQPLISYNYGAKKADKMIKFYKMCNMATIVINLAFSTVCLIWGHEIIGIFTSSEQIINIAYKGLILFNLGFFANGINLTKTVYYQAMEIPKYSNLICAFRSVIFFPISLIVLCMFMGESGVWISFLMAEVITLLVMLKIASVKKKTSLVLG